jgi:hypothetical protein
VVEEGGALPVEVVGADVATGVAKTYATALEEGNVADIVFFGEIVSSRQTMTATADNDHIVTTLWFGVTPGRLPMLIAAQGLQDKAAST